MRPLDFRRIDMTNIAFSKVEGETANRMDSLIRILLPSAVVYATFSFNFSPLVKAALTTTAASTYLLPRPDQKSATNMARGALLATSLFWWSRGNSLLTATSLLLPTLSYAAAERVYHPVSNSDRTRHLYALSLPILWSAARSFLSPVGQAATFAALPLFFSGVEWRYKENADRDEEHVKSYLVVNLGIAAAGVLFSALTAFEPISSLERAALSATALINLAHIGLICFGYQPR